jgi:glutamate/tyrosine decarboxylase-like PLP-dependent enzyme
MDPDALARALAADRAAGLVPALVNATAGTTVRGAFDPIRPLAELAHAAGAWLHVDGALGGSLVLCPAHRHRLDGLELADSFAWNPHKMMGVPLQCSVLLVARRGALGGSLDESADYLFQADDDELNPGHRSIQCGRRNDALKLWAAWLRLGDRGWDERIRRQLDLARLAAAKIAADPAFELLEPPPSINVCFAVRGRDSAVLCERLDREGRLKIGYGTVRGRRAIRLVCVNPDLDASDLDAILGEIRAAADAL